MKTPGQYVAAVRQANRISVAEVARYLNIVPTQINHWEADRAPIPRHHIARLCEAVGASPLKMYKIQTRNFALRLARDLNLRIKP